MHCTLGKECKRPLYVHLIGADEDPEYTGIMEEVNWAEKGL